MSFLTDLFEGNFGNLGTDLSHAPSSFANHPLEWAETAGALAAGGLGIGALAGGLGGLGAAAPEAATLGTQAAPTTVAGLTEAGADAALPASSTLASGSLAPEVVGAPFAEGGSQFAGVGPAGAYGGEDAAMASYGLAPGAATASPGIAAAPAATAAAPAAASGGVGSWLANNGLTLGALGLGGAGLLMRGLNPTAIPNQDQQTALAQQGAQLAASNQQLENTLTSPLVTGKLPEGQQQSINQGVQDAQTAIRAKYAQLGLSGSTAEMDALNHAAAVGQQQAAALEQSMAQMGIQAGSAAAQDLGVSETVYNNIMQAVLNQDTQFQNALTNFAGQAGIAAATMSRPTVNVVGAQQQGALGG